MSALGVNDQLKKAAFAVSAFKMPTAAARMRAAAKTHGRRRQLAKGKRLSLMA